MLLIMKSRNSRSWSRFKTKKVFLHKSTKLDLRGEEPLLIKTSRVIFVLQKIWSSKKNNIVRVFWGEKIRDVLLLLVTGGGAFSENKYDLIWILVDGGIEWTRSSMFISIPSLFSFQWCLERNQYNSEKMTVILGLSAVKSKCTTGILAKRLMAWNTELCFEDSLTE